MVYLLGYPRALSYDFDWIQAFIDHYGDTALVHLGRPPPNMDDADLIVLTHSVTAQGVRVPDWVYKIKRTCPLLMLSGNDYKHFDEKRQMASELQVDVIATLAPDTPFKPGNGVGKVEHIPHALNPKAFSPRASFEERETVVGFRGIRYPDVLGDDERNRVVEAFMFEPDCDVRFNVFGHPRQYADWLQACKATVATQAGAPGMKAVSSRHFDTIGSGAALVMTRGDYSGCLTEDHYIALDDDLGNRNECIERVKDRDEWEAVTARAFAHVMANHTYKNRMARLDELLWQ